MASAQDVETSVANNSPSQDSNHSDDLFQSRYVTLWFLRYDVIVNVNIVVTYYSLKHLTMFTN